MLHQVGFGIELRIQRQRQQKGDDRHHQRDLARTRRLPVAGEQHQDAAENRRPDRKAQ
jgi:hypothetical protein